MMYRFNLWVETGDDIAGIIIICMFYPHPPDGVWIQIVIWIYFMRLLRTDLLR
jgi:hypothetical protein